MGAAETKPLVEGEVVAAPEVPNQAPPKPLSAQEQLEEDILKLARTLYSQYHDKLNSVGLCQKLGLAFADKLEKFNMYQLERIHNKQNRNKVTVKKLLRPVLMTKATNNPNARFRLETPVGKVPKYFYNEYVSIPQGLDKAGKTMTVPYIAGEIVRILEGANKPRKGRFRKKFRRQRGGQQLVKVNRAPVNNRKNTPKVDLNQVLQEFKEQVNVNKAPRNNKNRSSGNRKNANKRGEITAALANLRTNIEAAGDVLTTTGEAEEDLLLNINKNKNVNRNSKNNQKQTNNKKNNRNNRKNNSQKNNRNKNRNSRNQKNASNKNNNNNGIEAAEDLAIAITPEEEHEEEERVNKGTEVMEEKENQKQNNKNNKNNKNNNNSKSYTKAELCQLISRHYMVRANLVAAIASALPLSSHPGFCQQRINALLRGQICLPPSYEDIRSLNSEEASIRLAPYINHFRQRECEMAKGFMKRMGKDAMTTIMEGSNKLHTQYKSLVDGMKERYMSALNSLKEILQKLMDSPDLTNEDLAALSKQTKDILDKMYADCQYDYVLGVVSLLQIEDQLPKMTKEGQENLTNALKERSQ